MCVFEVLHFLPLALLAAFAPASTNLKGVLMVVLSAIALIAGDHSHSAHAAFFGMFDPCFLHASFAAFGFTKLLSATNVKLQSVRA